MKFFKKMAIACLTLTMFAGLASFAACGGNTDNSSNSSNESSTPAEAEAYKFKIVKADGTPAVGYVVKLCITTCTFSSPADENGEISYAGTEGEGEYEIHVFTGNPMLGEATSVEFTGATKTPAKYSNDVITLTLKN